MVALEVTVQPAHAATGYRRLFVGTDASFEVMWSDSDIEEILLSAAHDCFSLVARDLRLLLDRAVRS